MNTRPVIKMGNPLLREVCLAVDEKEIQNTETQQLIDDMVATMRAENGAGIAAPQVGVKQRIFTIEIDNNPRYPDKPSFPLLIAINPSIEPIGEALVDSWEGCLSIPKIRGRLKRHTNVKLSGLDRRGQFFEMELTGFEAVVAQHELDHLNGILFIDRMEDMKTLTY